MATLFKPDRPYPLPAIPEIVQHNGKSFLRVREKGKPALYPLTADGKQYLKPAAKWAADVRLANGTRKRFRFSPNRDASAVMLADLLKKIEHEKIGIHDRFEPHRKESLAAHLDDWLASLRANARDESYIALKASRVRAAVAECCWVYPGDMSADRLETFLSQLRTRGADLPPIPSGQEAFTVREVAALLGGITRHHVADMVRRHHLEASGRGKARRFSLAVVETLRATKEHGRSAQTSNHYLQAVHQFARWLADNGRIERSPFARLKPLNARLDTRRRRGELSTAELDALLAATATGVASRGLTGRDRVMLYRVAAGTGFRAAELAALTTASFDLAATPPAAVLPAEHTKNRKGAVQPLAAPLAAELRDYLAGRSADEPVWAGSWVGKAAEMLRADLDAAGVPVEVDGPEGTETRDFHALRVVYISNVIRAGADLKQAMTLARHSDPRLTTARYARTRLDDLGAVVDKLPTPTTPTKDAAVLRMTGTDSGAATGAADGGSGRGRLRIREETARPDAAEIQTSKPLDSQGFEESQGLASGDEERGLARIRTGGDGFANRCLTTWLRGRR